MERMFRKKILVRVDPPTCFAASPFFHVHLQIDPPPSSSLPCLPLSDPDFSAGASLSVKVESLCWKLSRTWHVACLCFPHSLDIVVVYQRCQSESIDQVVKEICRELPIGDVGLEEEVTSSSLLVQALECALKCVFLDSDWSFLGNNLFVHSGFARDDERNHLCALVVRVQLEVDDRFTLLVSPDAVLFRRYKIADLLNSKTEKLFYNGDEVIMGDHKSLNNCYVLPSLCEGYLMGVQKVHPLMENITKLEELWFFKHGLAMLNDYFFRIGFTSGGFESEKWLPSAFVLHGSGLSSAPQTARVMKAVSALNSFTKIVEGWNFFGQGLPKVKVMSSFDIDSEPFTWTKAANAVNSCVSRDSADPSSKNVASNDMSILTDLLSVNDFRTPKPTYCIVPSRKLATTAFEEIAKGSGKRFLKDATGHVEVTPFVSTDKLKPHFQQRITSKEITVLGDDISSSKKIAEKIDQSYRLSGFQEKNTEKRVDQSSTQSDFPEKIAGTYAEEEDIPADAGKNDPNLRNIITAESDQFDSQTSKATTQSGNIKGKIKSMPPKVSGNSQKKENSGAIPEKGYSEETQQGTPSVLPGKRSATKRETKADTEEAVAKRKPRVLPDQCGISSKVLDCHSRGQLGSLTVAELKSFLTVKKAKMHLAWFFSTLAAATEADLSHRPGAMAELLRTAIEDLHDAL